MPDLSPILARTRDDEIMKIIFGVGAVIVWGIFQAIAAIAKKAEDAKRRQKYGRLPEDVATRTPSFPVPPPVPGKRAKQPKSKSQPKRRPTSAPQPAAIVRSPAPTPAYTAPAEPVPTRAKPANIAASANRIGRLLRQPASLRAAFILNEVLSQPVALRDASPHRH